jgi:hypothetical protein
MKCNPCVLCGSLPSVGDWNGGADYSHAAYCYNDLNTHATQCNGHSLTEAVARWNLLNPLPGETAKRKPLRAFFGRRA